MHQRPLSVKFGPNITHRTVAFGRMEPLDLIDTVTAITTIPEAERWFLVKTEKVRLDLLILRVFESLIKVCFVKVEKHMLARALLLDVRYLLGGHDNLRSSGVSHLVQRLSEDSTISFQLLH